MGDTDTLPAFDSLARCPKCHSDEIGASHHDAENERLSQYSCIRVRELQTSYPPEHICRWCRRCGFKWAEAGLDA